MLSKVEWAILQPFVLFVLSLSWIYLHVRMWGELCRWHLRPHHCRKIYDCACVCVCVHVPVCVESETWNFVAFAWRVSAVFCTERVNFTSLVYCTSHPSSSHFKDSSVFKSRHPTAVSPKEGFLFPLFRLEFEPWYIPSSLPAAGGFQATLAVVEITKVKTWGKL